MQIDELPAGEQNQCPDMDTTQLFPPLICFSQVNIGIFYLTAILYFKMIFPLKIIVPTKFIILEYMIIQVILTIRNSASCAFFSVARRARFSILSWETNIFLSMFFRL